jgi:hypothetical protein
VRGAQPRIVGAVAAQLRPVEQLPLHRCHLLRAQRRGRRGVERIDRDGRRRGDLVGRVQNRLAADQQRKDHDQQRRKPHAEHLLA